MANVFHLSNARLQQLLVSGEAGAYVSRNLVVSRNVRASAIDLPFVATPFLMEEMRFVIFKEGEVRPVVNMVEQCFRAGDLVFLGRNAIVQFKEVPSLVRGSGLALSDDLFGMAVGGNIPRAFDGHLRNFTLHLAPDEQAFLDKLHRLIAENARREGRSAQVTLQLVSAFLWQVDYLLGKRELQLAGSQPREQRVLADFIQLVSQCAPQHHDIDFYADRLCLSPRYMGTLVKRASGKTAKQWIDDALVTRIKIELLHSDKPINQIADEMGFTGTSFFTKFFRRMTGTPPNEFRKK